MPAIRRLTGFSGHAFIDGVQTLITSGNINEEVNPSYVNFVDIGRDNIQRSRVLYAPGTKIITGSINFDVYAPMLAVLSTSRLFRRGYTFTVQLFDGNQGKQATNCYASSISLSGSVGGLLTASINFSSKEFGPTGHVQTYSPGGDVYLSPATTLSFGYWFSGRTDMQVKDWSLSFNQAITPVYLNQIDDLDTTVPRYLKVGVIDASLSLTTYTDPLALPSPPNSIAVATSTFSIVGSRTSVGYSFSPTEIGTFQHQFNSAAVTLPNETIFS